MTKEKILANFNEEELFRKYCPVEFTIGKRFRSPLRDERTASFFIFHKDGKLWFKDQGSGEGGDVFKFIQKLHDLSGFKETLSYIANGNNINQKRRIEVPKVVSVARPAGRSSIVQSYILGKWEGVNKSYWASYGCSISIIKKYKVEPIEQLVFLSKNGNRHTMETREDSPLFLFRHSNKGMKFYNPMGKVRFISNTNETDVYGLEQAKDQDTILVGGNKDVVSLASHGISAITLNSEASNLSPLLYVHIMKTVKSLSIMYDRDKTGRERSASIAQQYNLQLISLDNIEFEGKDISDWILYMKRREHKNKSERVNLIKSFVNESI